jgi:ribosome assembly protein RRB1
MLTCDILFLGQRINPGEELVYDDQAYIVYQQSNLGAPCLSFDVIPESDVGADFPLQVYGVAGTQAAKVNDNNIIVFKVTLEMT